MNTLLTFAQTNPAAFLGYSLAIACGLGAVAIGWLLWQVDREESP